MRELEVEEEEEEEGVVEDVDSLSSGRVCVVYLCRVCPVKALKRSYLYNFGRVCRVGPAKAQKRYRSKIIRTMKPNRREELITHFRSTEKKT